MKSVERCPECGADWQGGTTCEDHFHQMLFWEAEDPSLGVVHHLMVLSYYLQHPTLYSPDGLRWGRKLLTDFIDGGIAPQEARQRDRSMLDSGTRAYKIKGTPEARGAYDRPVTWTMLAGDVVAGGMTGYVENVTAWARSINEALKQAYAESEAD